MKHITVVFKNAVQVEGSLLLLEEDEMVLKSLDGVSTVVIPNYKESILFYKENPSKEIYDELYEKPNKNQSDLEALCKAKGDLNTIERTSIKEKLQSPILQPIKDLYVPHNQSFPRSIEHSEKKTTRANTSFATGLQGMFSKKH